MNYCYIFLQILIALYCVETSFGEDACKEVSDIIEVPDDCPEGQNADIDGNCGDSWS